jgi:single-stranded-DNA-specific exonuclease
MTASTSWTGAAWHPRAINQEVLNDLNARGTDPILAQCIAGRWSETQGAHHATREPCLDDLHDPMAMLGMAAALDRLERAIRDRERVRIITDYDVDGTTSSLILQAATRLRGLDQVDYHIPDRFEEGYGFSVTAADRAADDGVSLIVTADIGVRDHAAVQRAKERGLDVLICDHHLPQGEQVPSDALVLCPPQAGCSYPNPSLAACGVSLKLAEGLLAAHPQLSRIRASLLKLAAVGTVADMVSLATPENRAIVTLGLRELNGGAHSAGLSALLGVAKLHDKAIDERDLGFQVGPRINAAGRVASARLVVNLLNSKDPIEARALARQVDELNAHRKQVQQRMIERALASVPDPDAPFIFVAHPEADDWHRGVAGIVAGRLKEQLNRPCAVIAIQGPVAVASVRSTPNLHAVQALDAVADLLLKHGGHPAAAGFSADTANLDAIRIGLEAFAAQTADAGGWRREHLYDVALPPTAIDEPLRQRFRTLGPFGMGNPEPVLAITGVEPEAVNVRANGRLLSIRFRGAGGTAVEAVWWDHAYLAAELPRRIDLLGTLGQNVWQGRAQLQVRVEDARPSA